MKWETLDDLVSNLRAARDEIQSTLDEIHPCKGRTESFYDELAYLARVSDEASERLKKLKSKISYSG